jgi:lipid-binding SYLF domain-containing protein
MLLIPMGNKGNIALNFLLLYNLHIIENSGLTDPGLHTVSRWHVACICLFKITVMKMKVMNLVVFTWLGLLLPMLLMSQTKEQRIMADSKKAKAAFIQADKLMKDIFEHSYGYAIFPNVGKGGIGVGGAAGKGAVYEHGKYIGAAKMVQVSAGFQFGGQAYREVIFFENKEALDRFMNNNLEFSGQFSAIAVKEGASANVKYRDGVMVFTQGKDGLMLEAALGGQKFTYTPM